MLNESTFRQLVGEAELLRNEAEGWYVACNEAIAGTTRGERWLGWLTVALGLVTAGTGALPALAEMSWVPVLSATATTVTALIDKITTSNREKKVPDLVKAGLDYGEAWSEFAKLLANWSIARAKAVWDEAGAANAIAPLRKKMLELGTTHARLGLRRPPPSTGPRSGTGFEDLTRGNVLPGSANVVARGRGHVVVDDTTSADRARKMTAVQMPSRDNRPNVANRSPQ